MRLKLIASVTSSRGPFSGNGEKPSAPRNASTAFAVSSSGRAMRRTMKYDVPMTITAPMTPMINATYSG